MTIQTLFFRRAIHVFLAASFLSACGTSEVQIAQPSVSESDFPGDGTTPIFDTELDSIFAARGIRPSVRVDPGLFSSPITSLNPMTVCVSGFQVGNFVTVAAPLTGSPLSHSYLSFSQYVDSSGGFCLSIPPSGRELRLEAGTYKIRVLWSPNGSGSHIYELRQTATFEVVN